MKLCWVTLHVGSLEQSLKFYRDILGLKVFQQFKGGKDVEIAMLGEADEPKVELLCDKSRPGASHDTGITVGFEVESLEQALELMKKHGIEIIRGPIAPSPHTRFFFVNDPSGFEVQLVENIK